MPSAKHRSPLFAREERKLHYFKCMFLFSDFCKNGFLFTCFFTPLIGCLFKVEITFSFVVSFSEFCGENSKRATRISS